MENTSRIFILHMGALGDIILSLPAMQFIRHCHPQSQIYLIGSYSILKLISHDLCATRLDDINQKFFISLFQKCDRLSPELHEYFKDVDSFFIFTRQPDSQFIWNLKKIFLERLHIISCLPISQKKIHITHQQLKSLKDIGNGRQFLPTRLRKHLEINKTEKVRPLANGFKVKKTIGIHPGSGSFKKCWPKESFIKLITHLGTDQSLQFILFLGPAEENWENTLLNSCDMTNRISMIKRPLEMVISYLKGCDIFIGNDSGMTHLSSALGVPTVAIFGPTDPKIWRPLGPYVRILSPHVPCAPCERNGNGECEDPKCLRSISIHSVTKAVRQFLTFHRRNFSKKGYDGI